MKLPWLPVGRTAQLPGRGELFYRHHQHPDPSAPTVLLLHGWTVSADLQFFTAYEELARHVSFVAPDHRGHGRSMRPAEPFELEDAADDAALLLRQLGVGPVIVVGYSMGGPIGLLLNRRHPDLVSGIVVEATALEWRSTFLERLLWKMVRLLGPAMRSWVAPSGLKAGLKWMAKGQPSLAEYAEWLAGELSRNSALHIVHAGRALSRYDSMLWAATLGTPSAMLITTADRLVKPRKQRALAAKIDAYVMELSADHLGPWTKPVEFSAVTLALVQHVGSRLGDMAPAADDANNQASRNSSGSTSLLSSRSSSL